MVLVDTSVWIDHVRDEIALLRELLNGERILVHRFVIGELAMGRMAKRDEFLADLALLDEARTVDDHSVLRLVRANALFGRGLSYIDAHLLASAQMTEGALLWTRDRRLREAAEEMSLALPPSA